MSTEKLQELKHRIYSLNINIIDVKFSHDYKNQQDKVIFVDKDYGEFSCRVYSVLNGANHPNRAKLNQKQKMTITLDVLQQKLESLQPHITEYDFTNFVNTRSKIRAHDIDFGWYDVLVKSLLDGCQHPKRKYNRVKQTNLDRYGVDNSLKRKDIQEKIKQTNLSKYGTENPFANESIKKQIKQTSFERYGVDNYTKTKEYVEKTKKTNVEKYGVDNPSKCPTIKQQIKETNLKKYGAESYQQTDECKQKTIENTRLFYGVDHYYQSDDFKQKSRSKSLTKYGTLNPMQNGEISRKVLKKSYRPANILEEFLINRSISYQKEYNINNKLWDFAVFKMETLHCLIEIDGEFAHSSNDDIFCSKQLGYYNDSKRLDKLPEGVNFVSVASSKLKTLLQNFDTEVMNINLTDIKSSLLLKCKTSPFPYPQYTEKRMIKDWERLRKYQNYSFKHGNLGNSIMTHFHPSIYHAHKKNKKSPIDAWKDETLLQRCIENRIIYSHELSEYHIARGFERNNIAQRVSIFSPTIARGILKEFDSSITVFDPFSGYSGRMLGVCSLGMKYIGSDINQITITEGLKIKEFLNIDNVQLKCKNVFDYTADDDIQADILLTCPPYGQTESWDDESEQQLFDEDIYIDFCVKTFLNIKTFFFVVGKKSTKYNSQIIDTITNKSHFSESQEYIIKIER